MALTFRMCLSFLCTVFLYPMKTDGANLALACHVLCQIRQFQQQGWLLFSHSVMSRCATPWTVARQASLFFTISQSLLKLMSIESMIPSNHLILSLSPLLLPSVFCSIRVFSIESSFHIRWPKYWSFSFSISPSNEYSGLISCRMDWLDLLAVQGTLKSLLQHHSSKASILQYVFLVPCSPNLC